MAFLPAFCSLNLALHLNWLHHGIPERTRSEGTLGRGLIGLDITHFLNGNREEFKWLELSTE
ncbi:hypothetical protein L208DRAFT_1409867, partial [Tricholoma matsutake]